MQSREGVLLGRSSWMRRLLQPSSEPAQQESSLRSGSAGTALYLYVKQTTAWPKPERVFPLPLPPGDFAHEQGNRIELGGRTQSFRLDGDASTAERRGMQPASDDRSRLLRDSRNF